MPMEEDILAYDVRRSELEQRYPGKFAVFHGGRLVGVFDDFNSAGEASLERFGDGPSLIRKIGDSTLKHVSISVIRSR